MSYSSLSTARSPSAARTITYSPPAGFIRTFTKFSFRHKKAQKSYRFEPQKGTKGTKELLIMILPFLFCAFCAFCGSFSELFLGGKLRRVPAATKRLNP